MALQSPFFAGDARVEAIAVSDAANVKFGDRGPHVAKIQKALNLVDGAGLKEDGIYGPLTQQAVLAFKRKRNIVNRSYQSTPDAIVGKMTIAALDKELCRLPPDGPVTVRIIRPVKSPPDEYRDSVPRGGGPLLSFAISQTTLKALGPLTNGVHMSVGGGWGIANLKVFAPLDLQAGQPGLIEVTGLKDGFGHFLDKIGRATNPAPLFDGSIPITSDPQRIEVVGVNPGSTFIALQDKWTPFNKVVWLVPFSFRHAGNPRYDGYETMKPHDHQPSRKWSEVCDKIEQPGAGLQGIALKGLCTAKASPETFAEWGRKYLFFDPTAKEHFDWYFHAKGADFIEDANIAQWVKDDKNLRSEVADFIRRNMAIKKYTGYIVFENTKYDSDDHRNAFGTIEKLYIEFDVTTRRVRIFFKDRYEWHPVCEPYYKKFADDQVRTTNSLHAALVEMKDQGAADYWMMGEATFNMSVFGL